MVFGPVICLLIEEDARRGVVRSQFGLVIQSIYREKEGERFANENAELQSLRPMFSVLLYVNRENGGP